MFSNLNLFVGFYNIELTKRIITWENKVKEFLMHSFETNC